MNSVSSYRRFLTVLILLGTISLSMAKKMIEVDGKFVAKKTNLHKSKMALNNRMRLYGKGKPLTVS